MYVRKIIYAIKEMFTDPITKMYVRKIILKILIIGIIIGSLICFGIYLNKLFEALLVLVSWLQFELAYRQSKLHKALQEPLLSVDVFKTPQESYNLSIENMSSIPAYSVNIKGIYDKNGKRISWGFWHQKVKPFSFACLRPKEKK
jgi:small-conductance mechanosensitive channel